MGNYAKLKANQSQIANIMFSNGYNVKNVQSKIYNGVEFITFEAEENGMIELFACAKLNSMYIAIFDIFNINNETDYTILNDLGTIIKNASYNSTTNNIKGAENLGKIDHSAIESIAK